MTELSLDDVERHALAGELDRVRVTELVWREPAPDPRPGSEPAELRPDAGADQGRPRVGPSITQNSGPTGSRPALEPGSELLQAPFVHADLAAAAALAVADQDRAAARVEVALGERERLLDPQPGAPQTTITARSRAPWRSSPAWRITATISSTVGGSAG